MLTKSTSLFDSFKSSRLFSLVIMSSIDLHYKIGFLVRMIMIVYGAVQDEIAEVKYTDIDYKVFTDAANHVVKGESPFDRYTYRYSPLLAYILVPNIIVHPVWGKLLFSVCDIITCVLIRKLLKIDKTNERTIKWCVLFWLYNPISIVISTRGNADSLSSLLVLGTLLAMKKKTYLFAGFLHAISIHFRLYPIAFSLCMYLSIQRIKNQPVKNKNTLQQFYGKVIPTFDRMKLVISCVCTLIFVTGICYYLYGYKFLFESLLYHLNRHDIRHNFSVYFYLQYLTSVSGVSLVQRVLTVLPQLILLPVISFVYGKSDHMYFCHLLIAFVMVTYNTVLTCQYFIWVLCLMPLVIPKLKLPIKKSVLLVTLWSIAQLAWLIPAYLLEFKTRNTFIHIWFQGIVFFCVNIFVITNLIGHYMKRDKHD